MVYCMLSMHHATIPCTFKVANDACWRYNQMNKWCRRASQRVSLLYSSYDNVATVNMHMMFKLINKQENINLRQHFPKCALRWSSDPNLLVAMTTKIGIYWYYHYKMGYICRGQTYIPYNILKFGICMINSGSFTVYFVLFSECPSYPASQYTQLHLTCYVNHHVKKSDQFRKWCGKGE